MILWTIRQILSLKKAIAGRANPSEMAWGFALGVAIGLVPKGNLVSMVLIGLLVSLRVNHSMAALVAVGLSFFAIRLDPWTHEIGTAILQSSRTRPTLERLWDLPLVPWTELNNTVVMGSTALATVALVPAYLMALPIFRWLAPKANRDEAVTGPEAMAWPEPANIDGSQRDEASPCPPDTSAAEPIETQIDIIRIDSAEVLRPAGDEAVGGDSSMNEALGYLLRRLRDSRQEDAA